MNLRFAAHHAQDEPAAEGRDPEQPHEPSDDDRSLLAEDPLTGLPWTETLLPLVTNWTGASAVHAVCLHFVGLGILAGIPALQSSHSLLRDAAERLAPAMTDDDRLTRFSGNKLLVFSRRAEGAVRDLLVAVSDRLQAFGVEVEGRRLPEVRIGMAALAGGSRGAAAVDAVNRLMNDAVAATVPLTEVVTPRQERDTEAGRATAPRADAAPAVPVSRADAPPAAEPPRPAADRNGDLVRRGAADLAAGLRADKIPATVAQPVTESPATTVPSPVAEVAPEVSADAAPQMSAAPAPEMPADATITMVAKPAPGAAVSAIPEAAAPSAPEPGEGHVPVTAASQSPETDARREPEEDPDRSSERDEETTMITRGQFERTPIRHQAASPAPAPATPAGDAGHRLILKSVNVVVTGLVATAITDLDFEGRLVRGKAIGRNTDGHQIGLVAEALTRAVTDLLPPGHGVVFRQAVPVSTEAGDVVVTVVELLTPDRTDYLFGVAPVTAAPAEGVARSVLNAVEHSTAPLLAPVE